MHFLQEMHRSDRYAVGVISFLFFIFILFYFILFTTFSFSFFLSILPIFLFFRFPILPVRFFFLFFFFCCNLRNAPDASVVMVDDERNTFYFLFPSDYIDVLHFIYYVHLPQPVCKDKYTFVQLLKESPYSFHLFISRKDQA